ncbi:uncharacterized protein LOC130798418 [Amaranthus tricolor]|uniref:uncharacterized protein LOC130798418 n=1 Tax=Amaranthus tricolor TaxID=29722 RepID=UPI00258B1EDB|nr:uncharacterized protein LOC130798418 [Amaranthus tricolor]
MEFWSEVTSFAEEAAKRSHERPQGLAAQVLYRADQIKSLSLLDSLNLSTDQKQQVSAQELERFGINGELREFVKEITMTTFQDSSLLVAMWTIFDILQYDYRDLNIMKITYCTNDGDDAFDDDFNKTVESLDDEHSNLVPQQDRNSEVNGISKILSE